MLKKQARKLRQKKLKQEFKTKDRNKRASRRDAFLRNLKIRQMRDSELDPAKTLHRHASDLSCELCLSSFKPEDIIRGNILGFKSPNFDKYAHRHHFFDEQSGDPLTDLRANVARVKNELIRLELNQAGFPAEETKRMGRAAAAANE